MNVDQDQEFLWIAVEAMFAPLPRNWQEFENENGQIYYYNHRFAGAYMPMHLFCLPPDTVAALKLANGNIP